MTGKSKVFYQFFLTLLLHAKNIRNTEIKDLESQEKYYKLNKS